MKRKLCLLLALVLSLSAASAVLAEVDLSENVTIKILCCSNPQTIDAGQMGMFQEAAKAANVTIEWTQVRSGWNEKKAVTLASNDYPDIFMGALTSADVGSNLSAFTDMTDLIAQYAPNVTRMYEECPDARLAGTYEGGVFSLPRIVGYRPQSYCMVCINKTWLDNLGLEIPTTMDELEQVLIAFRDNDCNGNGDPNDEIPLDWPSVAATHDIYQLSGAFGLVSQDAYRTLVIDDKISYLYEYDAFYKMTQYVHRWYQEGLVTPEVFTNDYAASTALCSQGDVARVGCTTGYSPANRMGPFSDQYVVISVPSGGDEYEVQAGCLVKGQTIAPDALVLSASSNNKERAMVFINELYSDDFGVQCYFGSFDTGLVTKYDDGTYSINMPTEYATIEESKWVYSLVDYTAGYFSERVNALTTAPDELTARVNQDKIYEDIFPDQIWPFLIKFSEADLEELAYIRTDITTYVNQKTAEWVVYGGIEKEWDEFQAYLKALGIDTMRDIYQNAYNNFYGL